MMSQDPTPGLSPVFTHSPTAQRRVKAPDSPWTVWVGMIGAVALGVLVFNGLSSSRGARAQTTPQPKVQTPEAAAPPPRPEPAPPAPPPPMAAPAPMVMQSVSPPINPEEAHWRAPTVVVDFGANASAAAGEATIQLAQAPPGTVPAGAQPSNDVRQSADERFSADVTRGLGDTARATQMRDLGRVIPQGTVIPAVLETAIDSDLPGSVRAVVSRDVRSFDGSRILVPRGSRLVGQYKSAAAVGQTRAFVVWSRIITPTGITIDVGSPATDRLGRGGLDGEVDTHFFRRFGSSILLSVVSAGAQALANSANNGDSTTLVIGSPTQANNVASIALQKQIEMPDTIRVAQGAPVQVSVARDLDFSSVMR